MLSSQSSREWNSGIGLVLGLTGKSGITPLAAITVGELTGCWEEGRIGKLRTLGCFSHNAVFDLIKAKKLPVIEIVGILSTFGLSKTIGPFPVVTNICTDNQQGRFFGLLSHSKKKTKTLFMAIQRCTECLGNVPLRNSSIEDVCSAE